VTRPSRVTRIAEIRFEVIARAVVPWLVPLLVVLAVITPWPPYTLGLAGAMRGRQPRRRLVGP
jgi:TRAP-type C4-dicarboxylate transport system permease large subunit